MIVYYSLPEKCPAGNVAVALGMFDGLHRGHLAVLTALTEEKGSGAEPCVFTFSTAGGRPESKTGLHLLDDKTRDGLLEGLGVKYVFQPEFSTFRDMSPAGFVKDFLVDYLNARIIFCGEDFRFGKNSAAGVAELRELLPEGSIVKTIPLVNDKGAVISTTRIRGLIQEGDMREAADLLGRAFSIAFPVEYGRQLGRTLNWPTINQAFPRDFVIPRFGVYATVSTIDGCRRPSVTNVGVKPTVGSSHILAETFIHDFSGDLYGQIVTVEFVKFIREEKNFNSIDELKAQIEKDNEQSSRIIGGSLCTTY